jgi:hypothetical protein
VFLVRNKRELCQFRISQIVLIVGRCRWLKKEMFKMERKGLKLKLRPQIGKPISISGRKLICQIERSKG